MGIKFTFGLLILSFILLTPNKAYAQSEFSTSYDINYNVSSNGETQVSEKITFKNLTEKYYASEYSLVTSNIDINEISAYDSSGKLESFIENIPSSNKKKITVKFKSQLTGKDKEYSWALSFKTKDFTDFQGNIKEITIPRIVQTPDLDDVAVHLTVPVSFGDPSLLNPKPIRSSESGGGLVFIFDKKQLLQSGILAVFGEANFIDFNLGIDLINGGLFPKYLQVALPADSLSQIINFQDIFPAPENVYEDLDGNFLAIFKIDKFKSTTVQISGQAKLLNNRSKENLKEYKQNQELLNSKRYWEKDNALILKVVKDIFTKSNPTTQEEKANLINQYIADTLSFDYGRLNKGEYERFGAVSILNNPQRALCTDYSDLFVTLSRSAGIPSREVIGYAHSNNSELKPISYKKDVLHCWAEYWNGFSWKMVDPTWENTTGGVSFFSANDLNHLTLVKRGYSSTNPDLIPDVIKLKPVEPVEFKEYSPNLSLKFDLSSEIFSGIINSGVIRISNVGHRSYPGGEMKISSSNLKLEDGSGKSSNEKIIILPTIPAFGNFEYKFNLRENNLTSNYVNTLEVRVNDLKFEKLTRLNSFFSLKHLNLVTIFIIIFLSLTYLTSIFLFLKIKKKKFKK